MSLVDQMVLAIGEYEFLLDLGTEELEDIARLALIAIRVPTQPMVGAGTAAMDCPSSGDARACWRAMINAAIAE
jgi:hypothetical protein